MHMRMKDEGGRMTAVTHDDPFVQILTIAPSGGWFSHEELDALFFPRILDGLLRLVGCEKYQQRLENGRQFE